MEQCIHGFVRGDIERRPGGPHRPAGAVMGHHQSAKPPAAGRDHGHQVGEFVFVHPAGDDAERGSQVFVVAAPRGIENAVPRRQQRFGRGAFVHDFEIGRQPRFDRKPAEQGFAKRVNRLDFQPAGRIQHLGEQPSGECAHRRGRGITRQPDDGGVQLGFRHYRPFAQQAADTVLHFRRRGAGEGEAENFAGRATLQQQAQHPVGEHLCLARPGRCRHPDGGIRCGGNGLGGNLDEPAGKAAGVFAG